MGRRTTMAKITKPIDRTNPDYWEKALPGESLQWFERFRTYLEMGHRRNLYSVYLKHWEPDNTDGQTKVSFKTVPGQPGVHVPGRFKDHVAQFMWEDRVLAFREWIIQESKKTIPLYQEELKLRERQMAVKAFNKAEELFDFPVEEEVYDTESGMVVRRPLQGNAMRHAIDLVKLGSEIGRRGADMSETDVLSAIAKLVEFGVFPAEALNNTNLEYDKFQEELRKSIRKSLEPSF